MSENVFMALKGVFHEPSRLAIVSALCKEKDGLPFNDLKDECQLTFGNLSSHLKTLQDAGAVQVNKSFEGNKPRTTILLTDHGRKQFVAYLHALENVLQKAANAVADSTDSSSVSAFRIKTA
jgi:DNA-binding HxlR family transcriptional regulator